MTNVSASDKNDVVANLVSSFIDVISWKLNSASRTRRKMQSLFLNASVMDGVMELETSD